MNTISKALYSLNIYANRLNELKNKKEEEGEDVSEIFGDLKFCYNLKFLAIEKMVANKYIIIQEIETLEYENGDKVLYSFYMDKKGLPFMHPTQDFDFKALVYSYDIEVAKGFELESSAPPFFTLKQSSKILLKYIHKSPVEVRYMDINIFNEKNTKRGGGR